MVRLCVIRSMFSVKVRVYSLTRMCLSLHALAEPANQIVANHNPIANRFPSKVLLNIFSKETTA